MHMHIHMHVHMHVHTHSLKRVSVSACLCLLLLCVCLCMSLSASPALSLPPRLELLLEPPLAQPHAESGAAFITSYAEVAGVPSERLELAEVSSTGCFLLLDVRAQGVHDHVKTDTQTIVAKLADAALRVEAAGRTLSRRYGLRQQAPSASEPSLLLVRDGAAHTTEGRALGITVSIIVAVTLFACCMPIVQLLLSNTGELGKLRCDHTRLSVEDEMNEGPEQEPLREGIGA